MWDKDSPTRMFVPVAVDAEFNILRPVPREDPWVTST